MSDEIATPGVHAFINLYWLPLGAGGRSVRWNGRIFEALVARREQRPVSDLYHSALEVGLRGSRFIVEMTPAWGNESMDRGVVCEGPVGIRWLGRSILFRYEVRRWENGVIPDANEAVSSPVRVASDLLLAELVLDLVPSVPTSVWGRDELRTGDMWNSNSLISWLLVGAGVDVQRIQPPAGGRAPGWDAGVVVARREK